MKILNFGEIIPKNVFSENLENTFWHVLKNTYIYNNYNKKINTLTMPQTLKLTQPVFSRVGIHLNLLLKIWERNDHKKNNDHGKNGKTSLLSHTDIKQKIYRLNTNSK